MKKVLLYYNFSFSFGGGDFLPLSFIAELQNTCDLTVALDSADGLRKAADLYGITIDPSAFKVEQVTPKGYDIKRHNAYLSLYRARRLKKLARKADICISLSNITDFGRPAHHFMNMLAFGDNAFTAYVKSGKKANRKTLSGICRSVVGSLLRTILGMRTKNRIIRDPRERVYPNSRFVERLMTGFYGPFNSTVFYPPTLFAVRDPSIRRDPLKVVCIGRILREKRITDIIDIVRRARTLSKQDLTLHIAGRIDQEPAYGETLRKIASQERWVVLTGALYGKDKEEFLTSGTYAVHAERDEAFGISVAEYLVAGLVPVVPDEGGSCEVVSNPDVTYHTNEDAAQILARLLVDEEFRARQQASCAERAKFFSRDAYLGRQRELLRGILAD
jgi:glycosyltransferase involved in cell wall biosynthesis